MTDNYTSSAARAKVVTRADVARLSGVSTATVSYVLNDGPKPVASKTRERVLEAIKTLNYRPNTAARTLSRGTSNTIGMLVADSQNPFFAQLITQLDREVTKRRHSLITVSTENSEKSIMDHLDDFAAQRVHGFVSIHSMNADERRRASELNLRTVLVNQDEPQEGVFSIRVDYRVGARDAVQHLVDHGCQRIAYIGANERSRLREQGWQEIIADQQLPYLRPLLTHFSLKGGYQAAQEVLASNDNPDGIFIASDQMSMGALAAFHDAGVNIPEDIAITSFDGTVESEYLYPPLTTSRQPMEDIAQAAISHLFQTPGSAPAGGSKSLPTSLVVRRSCGC